MTTALLLLVVTLGADPAPALLVSREYEVQNVARCDAVDGPVGAGCWISQPDCIAMAKERQALGQALTEASLKPADSGPGLKSFIGIAVVALVLGYAAGRATK